MLASDAVTTMQQAATVVHTAARQMVEEAVDEALELCQQANQNMKSNNAKLLRDHNDAIEAKRKIIKRLRGERDAAKHDLSTFQDQVSTSAGKAVEDIAHANREMNNKTDTISQLTKELKKRPTTIELEWVGGERDRALESAKQLQSMIDKRDADIRMHLGTIRTHLATIHTRDNSIREQQDTITARETDVRTHLATIAARDKLIGDLKSAMEKKDGDISKGESERKLAQDSLTDAKKAIANATKARDIAINQLDTAITNYDLLTAEKAVVDRKLVQQKIDNDAHLAVIQGERDSFQQKYDNEKKMGEDVRNELTRAKNDIISTNNTNSELMESKTKLSHKLTDVTARIDSLIKDADEMRKQHHQLIAEHDEHEQDINQMTKEVADSKTKYQRAMKERADLRTQLSQQVEASKAAAASVAKGQAARAATQRRYIHFQVERAQSITISPTSLLSESLAQTAVRSFSTYGYMCTYALVNCNVIWMWLWHCTSAR